MNHDAHRPAAPDPWDMGFGVVVLLAAAAALAVWFPLDIQGGFVEAGPNGKPEPGDAFFPVLLASALLALAVLHLAVVYIRRGSNLEDDDKAAGRLTPGNIRFFLLFHAIVIAGMAVIYWFGPLAVGAMNAVGLVDVGYRQLTDTAPYKYLGFLAGGGMMTLVLICWSEGGLRRRSLITLVLLLVALIVLFDVLLTNVQLPPNADY